MTNIKILLSLSICFLLTSSCKKETVHPNYDFYKKVAGTYDLVSADVQGDLYINILAEIPQAAQSRVNIIVNSARIFDLSWPEQEIYHDDQKKEPTILYAMKPTYYRIATLSAENEFILESSPSNDLYVVQPENIFLLEKDIIKCVLQKNLWHNGAIHAVKINITYKKSRDSLYDFFL